MTDKECGSGCPPEWATAACVDATDALRKRRRPVVLSTDCGCEMDDQWALALLALSPAIDLRAVVGAHCPGLTPGQCGT